MSRIYLVDDHELVRQGLRAMLESAGHVVVGDTGELTAALAAIVRDPPEVVLLDLHLGNRSGLELLVELVRRHVTAKVIVVSMSRRTRDLAEAMRLGAQGYVLKDSGREKLLAAIAAVLAGGRYLAAEEADLALQGLAAQAGGRPELTPRERQVLTLVARGRTSAAIGAEIHLSPKTVDTYRTRAMDKLGLADVPAVVRWAIREGLVALDDE